MGNSRPVGMKDVARAAGVSVGTVSNVLNRPDIVSADRRARVEQAIAELGYVRNDAARLLKMGRSRTVGAIVLDSTNPFYADLVHGMEAAAEDSGLAVIVGSSGNSAEREKLYLSLFEEQRVRGILLASAGTDRELVRSIVDRGTPVVMVEDEGGRGADGRAGASASGSTVSVDDVEGGRLAVAHLIEGGAQRPAMVFARGDLHQVSARIEGAEAAAAEAGLELELVEADDLSVLAGRAAGSEIAERSPEDRPDGVFCVNDLVAVGMMQAFAYEAGIAVPDEIAMVGYDDIAFARSTVVPLTSIAQPSELMGRTALALLEEKISAGVDAVDRHVRFSPELVRRGSSRG
ncbi:LacI family DNA-binding transcriptional regulator [Brachybacterium subflavum]|uniref:LacI family DNA-binding transcriptional regulator n=1 Tax=Brachybacterium subflavum TaxID=2585206 RepID=UPI001D0CFCD9|nr:LacI family DNA-binding transcriptional regulator [Brachybacterium subflavum]